MVDLINYIKHINIKPETYLYCFLAALLLSKFLAFYRKYFKVSNKHKWHRQTASKVLNRIRQFETSVQKERYIQKMSPFAFEDLILTAYKNNGCKIKRNRRKTGDGGIDGMVYLSKQWQLIQAKRYDKAYIRFKDIEEFNKICYTKKKKGLFIFVGKISEVTIKKAQGCEKVTLVYGDKLTKLM